LRREDAAGPPVVRRHEDVPARAADEAGSDEHGRVDREPRALPRPSAGRVHGAAPGAAQAAGGHDEVHPARGNARRAALGDPDAREDGVPRADRRVAARAVPQDRGRAGAVAAGAGARAARSGGDPRNRRAARGGRGPLGASLVVGESRDLAPRRGGRRAGRSIAPPLTTSPTRAMHILWVKNELLHPLDKGGRIRTYEMLRRLRDHHRVTYIALDDGTITAEQRSRALEYCDDLVIVPWRQAPLRGASRALAALGNLFSS